MGAKEKRLRGLNVAKEAPTQNPRPVQNRRTTNKPPTVAALKMADTPLSHAFRHIEPTWRNYIYYVDLAAKNGDEQMKLFVASYNALPASERRSITPERLCDLANVLPGELVGAVSRELWTYKQAESAITASVNHPKVIQQIAQYGCESPLGFNDRQLFLRATGTLPDKKGASIVINNTPQTANVNLPSAALGGFRPMDQSVIEMSKLLDEPAEELIAVPVSIKDADIVFNETD